MDGTGEGKLSPPGRSTTSRIESRCIVIPSRLGRDLRRLDIEICRHGVCEMPCPVRRRSKEGLRRREEEVYSIKRVVEVVVAWRVPHGAAGTELKAVSLTLPAAARTPRIAILTAEGRFRRHTRKTRNSTSFCATWSSGRGSTSSRPHGPVQ
jgi:hypothetical protein